MNDEMMTMKPMTIENGSSPRRRHYMSLADPPVTYKVTVTRRS